jgi:hypothetical protein
VTDRAGMIVRHSVSIGPLDPTLSSISQLMFLVGE